MKQARILWVIGVAWTISGLGCTSDPRAVMPGEEVQSGSCSKTPAEGLDQSAQIWVRNPTQCLEQHKVHFRAPDSKESCAVSQYRSDYVPDGDAKFFVYAVWDTQNELAPVAWVSVNSTIDRVRECSKCEATGVGPAACENRRMFPKDPLPNLRCKNITQTDDVVVDSSGNCNSGGGGLSVKQAVAAGNPELVDSAARCWVEKNCGVDPSSMRRKCNVTEDVPGQACFPGGLR